jgi:hypothetical protein
VGEKIRDYGTVLRLVFANIMRTAEANVWNRNTRPRGSEHGVATTGIIMSSTLDSTIVFFPISLKHLEPGATKIIRVSPQWKMSSSKISPHAFTQRTNFSAEAMYSYSISSNESSSIYSALPSSYHLSRCCTRSSFSAFVLFLRNHLSL